MSQLKEAKVMETKRNEETLKRQKAFEETQRRQREIQNTLRARKEEEKRMRLEKERRDLEEKGRGQDGGKEEEMKNVLEKEFDRLKKISVEKKVEVRLWCCLWDLVHSFRRTKHAVTANFGMEFQDI